MYCSSCGSKLNEGASFCQYCGNKQGGTVSNVAPNSNQEYESNQNGYPESNISNNTQTIGNDDELVRVYIGNNYDKIINSKFSAPTFFLGTLYLLYRKLWIPAGIAFGIIIVLGWFLYEATVLVSIGFFVLAFNFKKIYLDQVNKDIADIKKSNPNLSNDALKDLVAKKGGTLF